MITKWLPTVWYINEVTKYPCNNAGSLYLTDGQNTGALINSPEVLENLAYYHRYPRALHEGYPIDRH